MSPAAPSRTGEPARRRRRAWPWVLLGVAALLAGAGVAADAVARDLAQKAIADRVASALDVPDGTPVAVSIGGGPVLLQAVRGALDEVGIRVDGLALGPLRGDLSVTAHGVPLDPSTPTRGLAVRYAIPVDALTTVAREIPGVTIDGVALQGSELVASGSVSVLGAPLTLGLGLTPSVADGELAFDPTSIRIGDEVLTADQLRANPLLGGLASALLQRRAVCIADALPAAFTLTGLRVEGGELVATLDGSGSALGGPAFQQKGACPA